MRILLAGLVGLWYCVLPASAGAEATYMFTGDPFSLVHGSYTKAMSIRGGFTVASPLPPNFSGDIRNSVLSFAFFDGINTITNPDSYSIAPIRQPYLVNRLAVATDANGDIFDWAIGIYSPFSSLPESPGTTWSEILLWGPNGTFVKGINVFEQAIIWTCDNPDPDCQAGGNSHSNSNGTCVGPFGKWTTVTNSFSEPTATGTGMATASFTCTGAANCVYTHAAWLAQPGAPGAPPVDATISGVTFPQGLFDFAVVGSGAGFTTNLTLTFPQALPPGTVYYKYGATAANPVPHWYPIPATIAGNTITFSITDGGLGDDDLSANGTVVDQGGPGVRGAPPPSKTTLASNANPATVGTMVTFTAIVTGDAPTSTVRFTDGSVTLSGCDAVALGGTGNTRTASCTTGGMALGAHTILASYAGDAANQPSASSPLTQTIVAAVIGTCTIAADPYGGMTVQGGTLSGSTISNLQPNAIIQLGSNSGLGGSFAEIECQGFNLGPGAVLAVRSGASGQALAIVDSGGTASALSGTVQGKGANGAPAPALHLANPAGLAIAASATVQTPSGLVLDATSGTWKTGQDIVNAGTIDGGSSLTLYGANIKGGGAFKGNATVVSTFGSANNPVNGARYLANGLQLFPSTGSDVFLTINDYGNAPQYLNFMVNGNAHLWMPSRWSSGVALPPNNQPVPPGGVRAAGVPDPAYGASSSIFQASGSMTLNGGASNDFVFSGGIVLKSQGTLDLNGVIVNQGWTTTGQAFQGTFFESPNIVSSAGNIQVLSNNLNWVNFSTMPHAHVRTWTLVRAADGSAQYAAADSVAPHLNTYSILIEAAAAGQCWVCLDNTLPVNMY